MSNEAQYKSSQFNFYTSSSENGLIIYNSFRGTDSIFKVKPEMTEEAKKILTGRHNLEIKTDFERKLLEYGFLVPEEYDEMKILEMQYLENINNNILNLVILPTEQCNYRCKYCYESFERGKMSGEVQEGIIKYVKKKLHNFRGLSVSWFGGEPLMEMSIIEKLSTELKKICERQHKMYIANVTSNGYLLTLENFKKLKKFNVNSYTITIDGVKETHDLQKPLANGKPTYDVVMKNLLDIKNNVKGNMFTITIRTNFSEKMKPYLREYVDTFYKYFHDDPRFNFFIRPAGDWGGERVKDYEAQLFNEDSFETIFEELLSYDKVLNYNRHLGFLQPCGSICTMSFLNTYLIDTVGNVRKCSCDLDSNDNIIGKLEADGKMQIDMNKAAKWTHYFTASDKCKECSFAPACLDNACIANYACNRRGDDNCHVYEKKYLSYVLKLVEAGNELEVIE